MNIETAVYRLYTPLTGTDQKPQKSYSALSAKFSPVELNSVVKLGSCLIQLTTLWNSLPSACLTACH